MASPNQKERIPETIDTPEKKDLIDPSSFEESPEYMKYEEVPGVVSDLTDKQNGRRETASLKNLDTPEIEPKEPDNLDVNESNNE